VNLMKATGVVRPIDMAGRLVLPMELRRTMDLNEGDSMEIFTEDDTIILRKYEPMRLHCPHCGLEFEKKDALPESPDRAHIKTL